MSPGHTFSRREMLAMAAALGGLAMSHPLRSVLAQELERQLTPEQIMGPFYPVIRPLDHDVIHYHPAYRFNILQ